MNGKAAVESERHYEGENINLHFHFCPGHSIPHTPTPPLIMAKVMNIKSLPHHPGGIHSEHNHTHAEEEVEGHSELTSITYYLQLPCLLSCLDPSVHSTIHPYLCGRPEISPAHLHGNETGFISAGGATTTTEKEKNNTNRKASGKWDELNISPLK